MGGLSEQRKSPFSSCISDQLLRPSAGRRHFSRSRCVNPAQHSLPAFTHPEKMMTDTSHDIRTLNGLIATTIDSVDGYRTSAEATSTTRASPNCSPPAPANARRSPNSSAPKCAASAAIPRTTAPCSPRGHRAFLNLKAAVTGRDDQAIVNEVERGEDHIKAKYEAALADETLSPETPQPDRDRLRLGQERPRRNAPPQAQPRRVKGAARR